MAKRSRTERRKMEREAEKLARAKMKLAALETGGAPERPIEVESASVIEVMAASACIVCGERVRVEEHLARTIGGRSLRVVNVVCPRCGARRSIWFRIGTTLPS